MKGQTGIELAAIAFIAAVVWQSGILDNLHIDNNLFAIKALQITESIEVYMKLSLVGGTPVETGVRPKLMICSLGVSRKRTCGSL